MTEGLESPGSQRGETAAPQVGWHQELLEGLSSGLRAQEEVKALVLTGFLADDAMVPDEWSDVDLTAVVADDAVPRLLSDRSWLEEQGQIVGLDRREGTDGGTLRVCFAPCRRVDICLVRASVARDALMGPTPAKCRAHRLLWSRLPELAHGVDALFPAPRLAGPTEPDIGALAEGFWFTASVTVARTMRRDLLVALHLVLALTRDCLMLQMIRRDRARGTNVHRFDGLGSDLVARACPVDRAPSRLGILRQIGESAEVFDQLCSSLITGWEPRAQHLRAALGQAEVTYRREDGRESGPETDAAGAAAAVGSVGGSASGRAGGGEQPDDGALSEGTA